jgi:hypothetical protein
MQNWSLTVEITLSTRIAVGVSRCWFALCEVDDPFENINWHVSSKL